jgi:hypothetical protein
MRVQIVVKARKNKVFRVSGGVRPSSEIARISNKIHKQLLTRLLSKNALFSKNPYIIALFIQVKPNPPAI